MIASSRTRQSFRNTSLMDAPSSPILDVEPQVVGPGWPRSIRNAVIPSPGQSAEYATGALAGIHPGQAPDEFFHPGAVAPLIVIPANHFHEPLLDDLRECGIENTRVSISDDV
jgi:hypothetical protein